MGGNEALRAFCQQVRRRSREHVQAISLLEMGDLLSPVMAILRQEIDSLIRVIYLLTRDENDRNRLILASVSGERWTHSRGHGLITDREMVDISNKLNGWTQSVYKYGCAFVHLSNFHDYDTQDPLSKLTIKERNNILKHMRHYHHGPSSDHPTISDILPLLPQVLRKISANLDYYLKALEADSNLNVEDI
jgi:hypothetical protein